MVVSSSSSFGFDLGLSEDLRDVRNLIAAERYGDDTIRPQAGCNGGQDRHGFRILQGSQHVLADLPFDRLESSDVLRCLVICCRS